MYIGPEFQLGQVYDGNFDSGSGGGVSSNDPVVLYRPVYACIENPGLVKSQKMKKKYLMRSEFDELRRNSQELKEIMKSTSMGSPKHTRNHEKVEKESFSKGINTKAALKESSSPSKVSSVITENSKVINESNDTINSSKKTFSRESYQVKAQENHHSPNQENLVSKEPLKNHSLALKGATDSSKCNSRRLSSDILVHGSRKGSHDNPSKQRRKSSQELIQGSQEVTHHEKKRYEYKHRSGSRDLSLHDSMKLESKDYEYDIMF